jgi:bifunctional UDP-N-acetylglucosamine pyrophosphorylase / glucosamine-1-phosphate N-acetyltransferase
MNERRVAAVILAAGRGTRMKSERAKVLHAVAGLPMVHYPVELTRALGCRPTVLVTGHQAEAVQQTLAGREVLFALQQEQLGTGHALLCAQPQLARFSGTILLLCGDVPLLRRQTLEKLLAYHAARRAAVTVLTAEMPEPYGYGRILRDGERVLKIVEEKDATPLERSVCEINTGIYAFEAPFVFEALAGVGRDNAQGEYYLTDVVAAACAAGRTVAALAVADAAEAMGINDRCQLAEAGAIMRRRINRELMLAGVTLQDPETAYIDPSVRIGEDTIVAPGVHLRGRTVVGRDCRIDPGVTVTDCIIGDGVRLKAGSVLEGAVVGSQTDIGPMAHLRPGTELAGHNKIGNFVETKKAIIGAGSKASHLTYIGDAEIGMEVNIGCGTITCNYDGVNKHKTIIEDHVFVGSDTQFVAPVRIGRGSLIGAGSTITRDVPADALAISRSEQRIIEGWVTRKTGKQKKHEA